VPVEHRIDPEQHLVCARAWGVLTDKDIRDAREALACEPGFTPDLAFLFDLTDVTEVALSTVTIWRLSRSSVFGRGARQALVVSSDVAFGMARMYVMLTERTDIEVFRNRQSALDWLSLRKRSDEE